MLTSWAMIKMGAILAIGIILVSLVILKIYVDKNMTDDREVRGGAGDLPEG